MKKIAFLTFVFSFLYGSIFVLGAYSEDAIYFTDDGASIQRIKMDGTSLETVFIGSKGLNLYDIDYQNKKMYFADGNDLARANLDGTGEEILLPADFGIAYQDLSFDFNSQKEYTNPGSAVNISWSLFDGSLVQDVIRDSKSRFISHALDLTNGKLYFTDTAGDRIGRVNLDGTDIETLIHFNVNVDLNDIQLDLISGKMYWLDQPTNKIQRANLDGTDIEDLVSDWGRTMTLDIPSGKMYWVAPGMIRRANLDGSDIEDLHSSRSWKVALGPSVPFAEGNPIPEPASLSLLGLGLGGLLFRRKKRW